MPPLSAHQTRDDWFCVCGGIRNNLANSVRNYFEGFCIVGVGFGSPAHDIIQMDVFVLFLRLEMMRF
jgi:hypothetical protein